MAERKTSQSCRLSSLPTISSVRDPNGREPSMSTRHIAAIEPGTAPPVPAELLNQYGCGDVRFSGNDGLYERHLLFDNAIEREAATAREQFEAFAHSVRDVLSQRWILTER